MEEKSSSIGTCCQTLLIQNPVIKVQQNIGPVHNYLEDIKIQPDVKAVIET
jgi:hypothetical protein